MLVHRKREGVFEKWTRGKSKHTDKPFVQNRGGGGTTLVQVILRLTPHPSAPKKDDGVAYMSALQENNSLPPVLLVCPGSVVQGAHLTCLEPTRNAVRVKRMAALPPR